MVARARARRIVARHAAARGDRRDAVGAPAARAAQARRRCAGARRGHRAARRQRRQQHLGLRVGAASGARAGGPARARRTDERRRSRLPRRAARARAERDLRRRRRARQRAVIPAEARAAVGGARRVIRGARFRRSPVSAVLRLRAKRP
ncbi:sulfite reductase (NADPH) flavo, alpha subunit domain protein [Burkholderia pseudomallei]|nr:sulfite reductase (NADPH) flavo, alpha subunit domain protein [Burkholderia pseudomallei]